MRASYSDAVTVHLAQEVENGRLMRLMVKLMSVLERADMEPQWTETGIPFSSLSVIISQDIISLALQRGFR